MNVEKEKYSQTRFSDVMRKISHFLLLIGTLFILNREEHFIKYYSDISEFFKIHDTFTNNINTVLLGIFLLSIYMLINLILNSKYNNTKLEIIIYNFLNKIPKFKINYKIYTLMFTLIYPFCYYLLLDFILNASLVMKLTAGVDYSTMEYLKISSNLYNYILLIIMISIFTFFMLTKPNEKINYFYIYGNLLFILCILTFKSFLNDYLINLTVIISSMFIFINLIAIISSIFILFIYFSFKNLSKIEKIKNIAYFIFGYIILFLLILITKLLITLNPNINYINENINDRVISINGKDYNYNTSIALLHKDNESNREFEYLIESYAGQSMHSTLNLFDYIFSKDFKGDKERSYQLFAKIYEKNSLKIRDNQDKAFFILNNGVNFIDFIPIIIPYIIYEVSPYESTIRTIENVLNKDYQAAVDNYIEYGLNNDTTVISKLTNKEREDKGFVGSPIYQGLIYSLVSNGYANFDLEKVKNDKYKEMWKNKLEKKKIQVEKYSDEKVEKWFKAFGV